VIDKCPRCQRGLVSADTYGRTLAVLKGMVDADIKVVTCPDHQDVRVVHQDVTRAPLVPNVRADMDVTVLIGLLHWRLGMKRYEVKAFLGSKGIYLSEATISNRSLDFLLLFAQLHRGRHGKLRRAIERRGGMALHMDGTHRSGGRVTFVLQEDHYRLILDAGPMPSEGEEHVTRMLASCKEMYGSPLVAVRDGAESLKAAIAAVLPGVPQQLCQPHFLRSLERSLLSEPHAALKRAMVQHHLSARLRRLRVTDAARGRDMLSLERVWVHMGVDHLMHPVKHQTKWLSDPLPYYFQYECVREVAALVRRLVQHNASRGFVCAEVMELDLCLRETLEDAGARASCNLIRRTIRWMDMARVPMRISRGTHLKDTPPDNRDLEKAKASLRAALDRTVQEGREMGGEFDRVARSIRRSFEEHWEELFVPYPIVKGRPFRFRRHNNGLESAHRWTRKSIRERTGREQTRVEMEQHGDLLAILSNLWNPAYHRLVLNDVQDLSQALGQYIPDLPRLREEYRLLRVGPERPVPDEDRLGMMQDFLKAMESSEDDTELLSRLEQILKLDVPEVVT